MDYIAQPKDYWIAQGAITITLNALGNPNRIQGSVASGAAILCYIEGVDGLGYDNGHRFKTWPLSLSPTYFNSNTPKYVYAAIPRTSSIGTQAVVVFPSEKLDVYGKNSDGAQVGSSDYYYIWLQGIISSSGDYGTTNRTWTAEMDFGKKGTDEDLYDDTDGEWYQYSKVSGLVTFLKNIQMKAGTTFHNLFLGYKELTGVATGATSEEYVDSEVLVATPSYIHQHYLRKDAEDVAQEPIGFLKGLWVGVQGLYEITAEGIAKFKSLFVDDITAQRMQVDDMQSSNYTGDGIADTGWRLTKDYNGHSKLTVDELYVRMKAVFESLEVKKELVSGGNQVQSCAASVISKVDYLNANKEAIGYDEYKVPFTLRSAIMMLFKGQNPFGSYSRTRKVRLKLTAFDRQNVRYVRCYFLAKEGDRKIQNWWRVADPNDNSTGNDMARCQTFNLASDSISERDTYFGANTQKQGNIFWWRKVAGVSTTPVEVDGKQYHYFDVYCNPLAEAAIPYSYSGAMEGSDIPAPGDEVSQWGNDNDIDRMNLIVQEVNGQDAAIKMYEGINQFSMETGLYGNPLKIRFAPKTGCKVATTKWEVVTESFVAPVPVECGNWLDITPVQGQRTARYYEIYQHNGSSWLCVASNGGSFKVIEAFTYNGQTYEVGDTVNQATYDCQDPLFGVNRQMCCARETFGTTTDEPSTSSAAWRQYAAKGIDGTSAWIGTIDRNTYSIQCDASGTVTSQQSVTVNLSLLHGSEAQSFKISGIKRNSTTVGNSQTLISLGIMFVIDNDTFSSLPSAAATAHSLGVIYFPTSTINGSDDIEITLTDADGSNQKVLNLIVNGIRPGANGTNGKDGWMITADPANVIITQALGNDTTQFSTQAVTFTAKKGNVDASIVSVLINHQTDEDTKWEHFTGSVSGTTVTVTSPTTYTPQGGTAQYYTEGYFIAAVGVTDPDSNNTITFHVKVPCYANLLGTWKQSVEDGTENVIAEKLSYEIFDDNVHTIEETGEYIRGWGENTSILTKKVNDGKNLLTGVLTGNGWLKGTMGSRGIIVEAITDDDVDNGHINVGNKQYLLSPSCSFVAGKSYTLSFKNDDVSTLYVGLGYGGTQFGPNEYVAITKNSDGRFVHTFEIDYSSSYHLVVDFDENSIATANRHVYEPMFEEGTEATAFDAGDTEVSSQIKQTADRIIQRVADDEGDISQLQIDMAGITSQVSRTAKKNLFPKNGQWKYWDDGTTVVSYDGTYERWYADNTTHGHNMASPVVSLQKGKHCFSAYVPSGRTFDTSGNTITMLYGTSPSNPTSGTSFNAESVGTVSGDTIKIGTRIYQRCYAIFNVPTAGYCDLNLWGSADEADVAFPKLAVGDTVDDREGSVSYIRQTADNIDLTISNMETGLEAAGIHLDGQNSYIKLTADNVGLSVADDSEMKLINFDLNQIAMVMYSGDHLDSSYEPTVSSVLKEVLRVGLVTNYDNDTSDEVTGGVYGREAIIELNSTNRPARKTTIKPQEINVQGASYYTMVKPGHYRIYRVSSITTDDMTGQSGWYYDSDMDVWYEKTFNIAGVDYYAYLALEISANYGLNLYAQVSAPDKPLPPSDERISTPTALENVH